MAFAVRIRVEPRTGALVGVNQEIWTKFVKSLAGGSFLNLSGVIIECGKEEKSVRDILETPYKDINEVDLCFLESLAIQGKLYLVACGSLVSLVNGVNGIFNARLNSAIPVTTEQAKKLTKFGTQPYRSLNGLLVVGNKPSLRRGQSSWDPDLLKDIVKKLTKDYQINIKLKEVRFEVLLHENKMYVELTYDGRYCLTCYGRLSEYNPAVILAIAIGSFNHEIGALREGKASVVKEGDVTLETV